MFSVSFRNAVTDAVRARSTQPMEQSFQEPNKPITRPIGDPPGGFGG